MGQGMDVLLEEPALHLLCLILRSWERDGRLPPLIGSPLKRYFKPSERDTGPPFHQPTSNLLAGSFSTLLILPISCLEGLPSEPFFAGLQLLAFTWQTGMSPQCCCFHRPVRWNIPVYSNGCE